METLQTVFLICTIVGGVLFLLRLVLQFMGADTDVGEVPDDIPTDIPDDVPDVDGAMADSDISFRVISFQGIMAFLLMFGVVGLCVPPTTSDDAAKTLILAIGAGVATMVLQAKLMVYLLRLQSSGTLDMRETVGKEGTVYLTIPADGTGKAQIVVQNQLKLFDATSKYKEEIPTGERVRVTEVASGRILVVEKVVA